MRGEFDFNPEKILNKTLIFDNKKNHEEIIMDMITDVHNDKTNDENYIEQPIGSNYFTFDEKMEDEKLIQKARNIFSNLKTDPNSILFSEEKIDERLFKIVKKSKYLKDSLFLKLILLADNKLHDDKQFTAQRCMKTDSTIR